MENLIKLRQIIKIYEMGEEVLYALHGIDLDIKRNEYLAIMGPSGSGKSTIMNIIGCLDTPSSGLYKLNGTNVNELDDNQLAEIRNKEIGFIFQTFNLMARSDTFHNVELPLIYSGMSKADRIEKAEEA